jgi:hypothetical protein
MAIHDGKSDAYPVQQGAFGLQSLPLHDITAYVGLLKDVVELRRVTQEEQTRRLSIAAAHQERMTELIGQIRELEIRLVSEARAREYFTKAAMDSFSDLMRQGQTDVAMAILDRVAQSFSAESIHGSFNHTKQVVEGTGLIRMDIRKK